ncbi:MAG: GNAT family N-acetyltransferase [Treponematales bacterium]
MVREARAADAGEIAGIYNFFVERTAVSFEETAVTAPEVAARMDGADGYPWLVWEEAGAAAGFACLRRWQQRAAYRRAAEVAVYVRRGRERRGIGSALLARLLEEARRRDIHALVSVITVPNAGSVALHEKFGFRQAGCLREIGWKLGRWRDVGYWELLLGGGGGGGTG